MFDYHLPPEAIAQHPAEQRDASRLLRLDRERRGLTDHRFAELPELLRPGDCLVVNDSRVIPARVVARDSRHGGETELLFATPETAGSAFVLAGAQQLLPTSEDPGHSHRSHYQFHA